MAFLEQMAHLEAFLDELRMRPTDGAILAVSHENPIMAVRALTGTAVEEAARGHIANCGWLEIEWPPA